MILKWLGALLLVALALLSCAVMWRRMYLGGKRLRGWIALLTYVRGQISCFATPLHAILASADEDMLIAAGIDFEISGEKDFAGLCREASEEVPRACGAMLRALSEEIGTIWRQEQLERLDYYIEALSREEAGYAVTLREQLRLRTALTLCGTLGVILLIW